MAQRLKLACWTLAVCAGLALVQMNWTADAAASAATPGIAMTQPTNQACGWMPGREEYAVWGCISQPRRA
jgi:hypothetical protein